MLSVIALSSPAAAYDFNGGLPPNTAIYGSAFLSNGVLELNTNAASQYGSFLTADLAPGVWLVYSQNAEGALTFRGKVKADEGQPVRVDLRK